MIDIFLGLSFFMNFKNPFSSSSILLKWSLKFRFLSSSIPIYLYLSYILIEYFWVSPLLSIKLISIFYLSFFDLLLNSTIPLFLGFNLILLLIYQLCIISTTFSMADSLIVIQAISSAYTGVSFVISDI